MSGNRWTVLLLCDGGSPVRQLSVSQRALRFVAGGAGLLLLFVVALLATLGLRAVDRVEAERLRSENEALSAELEAIRSRVAGLEGTLNDLQSRSSRMRILAGLDSVDSEILEVGIGGPGMSSPETHPLSSIDPELGETAFTVTYDLEALIRRTRLLSESMDETADSLRAHRELLESTPSILPTSGLLSSRFSRARAHPIHHQPLPHEGVDISATRGTPILAAARGRVVRAQWVAGYGQMVEIDHGFGYTTRYGHASRILVRPGQRIERGDVIAQVGSSGIATSSHLHYEVRVNGKPQNPMNFVISGAVP